MIEKNERDVVVDKPYKTFTVGIDQRLDSTLERLKIHYGKTSRAEIFRMGIALLSIAADAQKEHRKLTISDQDDVVLKEIVLP